MRKGVLAAVAALALVASGCTAPSWASVPAMSDQIPLPIDARFTPTPDRPPPAQVTANLPDLGEARRCMRSAAPWPIRSAGVR